MKLVKISMIAALACGVFTNVMADDAQPKRSLKGNMMEVYNVLPKKANSLSEALTDGVYYGRLRMNTFNWDWKSPEIIGTDGKAQTKDNYAFGLGGSLIYKTAPIYGLSATAGYYFSSSPIDMFRMDAADASYIKAGKDTISRYDVKTKGHWYMGSLAQAYVQYDISKTSIKLGRQIFESFITKSNDTKMIPNTFEGISVEMKEIPQTKIRAAYFTAQKLRDHTTFHDVITYSDSTSTSSPDTWNNNDDSAVHKGLSYANFQAAGKDTEHELIVADFQNKSIPNLQIDVTYASVPDVVSSVTGELNYAINLPSGYVITPGVRYMQQMDDGGGAIGGASLSGKVSATTLRGYKTGDSLDSSLYMARLVVKKGPMTAQVAYSAVEDAADIVAPWRGFPTGGYTRAMAQYNWWANTKTTAAEVKYDFGKAKIIPGFSAMARYAMQNFDENKQFTSGTDGLPSGVQADSNILHIDLIEQFTPDLQAKIRFATVSADARMDGNDYDSYNEYRFEVNYLF